MKGLKEKVWFMSMQETTLGDPLLVQYSIHLLSISTQLYCSPWLNLALVSQAVIVPALWWPIFVCQRLLPGMLSEVFHPLPQFRQQASKLHQADWQVTGRLSGATCHFTAHRSAEKKAPFLKCRTRSTYTAAGLSVMTFAIQCDLFCINTSFTHV